VVGVDWLAIAALVISGLVALAQIFKEFRESRIAAKQEDRLERDFSTIPIKGAGDAVIALQHAVTVANTNEDRLRARIVYLEKENDAKDDKIMSLERRVWTLERQIEMIKGGTNG
jgi:predicted  nucleic acid-binding Zn-ribbon protein